MSDDLPARYLRALGDADLPGMLALFAQGSEGDNEITRRLRGIDVDDTTPRQALELLAELKKLAE